MEGFESVEFDLALTIGGFEAGFAFVGVLDRDARKPVVGNLVGGEDDGIEGDIQVVAGLGQVVFSGWL